MCYVLASGPQTRVYGHDAARGKLLADTCSRVLETLARGSDPAMIIVHAARI